MTDRFQCADHARVRQDPLAGTAATAGRWLLIEHNGPWAPDALAGSGIEDRVQAVLAGAARAASTRIVLIRRPGRPEQGGLRRWAIMSQSAGDTPTWGTWLTDGDLLAPALVLTGAPPPADAAAADAPPQPLLLVCTHGRHDTCCAVRGRPVAAALAKRWPETTWECSHIGGDRFAGNVVVLPDGTYYGNLDAESAVGVVDSHLGGRVDAAYLRGTSSHPPTVQAAVVAAHERLGPAGPRDVVAFTTERLDEGSWRVCLTCRGSLPTEVVAVVTRSIRPAAQLTCRAPALSRAYAYTVAPFE